jgi:peroxiredoxin
MTGFTTGPPIGQPAPDFTLPDTSGVPVTLSQFRGASNVLLAFLPAAFAAYAPRNSAASRTTPLGSMG